MADDVFDNAGAQENPTTDAPDDVTAAAAPDDTSVQGLLQQLIEAQKELRADNAKLRQEISKSRVPSNNGPAILKTDEQLLEERFADIRDHSHYCPGCGNLSKYAKECTGLNAAAGHAPIEMVSVEELLAGDKDQHTPAPATV